MRFRKYSLANFANFVCICITRGKVTIFELGAKMVTFSALEYKLYKICKLHNAIFYVFHNISPPNFVILPILRCSF